MRSLKKNQQEFWYSTYAKQIILYKRNENREIEYIDDGKGNLIPIEIDTKAGYNNPVPFCANISDGKGTAQEEVFGKDIDFTRTISTTDLTLPIDELSLVWIESEPKYLEDGMVDPNSADYQVATRPIRSLNSIMIALKALPKGEN